nr:adhesion G-protein coupled receptor G2 isoform X2 [Misgurnus anguillicaudatus]
MVRRVCMSEDVKHNRLSRHLYSSSRMATMGRQSFGHRRSLDYVLVLILFLQFFSAATTIQVVAAATVPSTTTTTVATTTTTTRPLITPAPKITTTARNATAQNATAPNMTTTAPKITTTAPNATAPNTTATAPKITTSAPNATAPNTTPPNAPKITTTAPNATATNTTATAPKITTAGPNATAPNATDPNAAAPNTTAPNMTTTAPNMTTPAPNATAPNTTATAPNATAPNTTATTPNATAPNMTTTTPNATMTTIAPNATMTTIAPNATMTTIAPNATAPNMTTTAPNATAPNTTATVTPPTNTTPALTTTPVPCNFSVSCNQMFYWMLINTTDQTLNAENVTKWLNNLDNCIGHDTSNKIASTIENQSSLVQNKSVFCNEAVSVSTTCEVLLELRGPANVCCIRQTVLTASNSFDVNVVGDIEGVGVCLNSNTSSEQICNQIQKNCTLSPLPTTTEPPCNCLSNCNSSEAYYSVTLENMSMNATGLKPYLHQLFEASCDEKSECKKVFVDFASMYSDFRVAKCSGETLQNCTVIVKLSNPMNVCKIKFAIDFIIKQQNAYIHITDVTRVAMCSWSSNDTMGQNITLIQSSTSFDEFCSNNNNNSKSLVNCLSVAFLLNDSCDANQTLPNSTATPPSTTESTNTSVDAEGLLKLTANASSLNSSQVDLIISQLEKLLSGPNVSMGLANTSVGIVNNLLDVPADVMFNFSKRANGLVDTVGLKLVVSGESEKLITSSLALAVKKVNGTNFEMTSFSISDSSNLQVRSDSNRDVVDPNQSTSLGSITLPASLTQNLSPQDQQLASRVQFNFYQKDTFFQDKRLDGLNRKLISGILSTSVSNLSISNLQKNVTITFKNTQNPDIIPKTKEQNVTISVKCVFWDLGLNGGAGGWKSDGCHTVNSSALETQCSCNHLTSFGILLDISKTPIDPLQNTILTYITYIGCGISAIFLSITLLTYLAFEKLRKDIPSKILIHLCLALLLLNLVFLIDPWLAQYQDVNGLCISTAFFLHYFLLASFTWMAMEAVHMYLAIVKVFNTYVSRFMLKIGFAGWGIPLIVVIIVIATNKIGNNYGLVSYAKFIDGTTDYFCWITNDIVFYVAVVVYFCIVFLINFAMFIVVLVQLCRIKRQNPQNVQNRSSWQELRSVAGLTVLLGITWGFAFFAWGPVNLAFMYLFAIFNTFQGLFIFIFHCAMKENVRRQWRAYLCCGKLRLPEHSDWSHTQTQKIKKTTKKRPSSAQSNNSSSSFLNNDSVADAHMGIGNPYDDTIITASEENPSDVVLNEISNKHLRKRSY